MAPDRSSATRRRTRRNAPDSQRLHIQGLVLLGLASLLLLLSIGLAQIVLTSSQSLDHDVAITDAIANGNLRTIGQAQRELLRMEVLLSLGVVTPADLALQRGFATQRMQESSLEYQEDTLGSPELLARARRLRREWETQVVPILEQVEAAPITADTARTVAIARIRELELGVNDLISAGENNRKAQASKANATSRKLLRSSKGFVGLLLTTIIGFIVTVVIALTELSRADRLRAEDHRELRALNGELAKLSQVASRTDNAVIITDATGVIEWVNDAFTTLTGYGSEAIGQRPGTLLQGPGTDAETVAAMHDDVAAGRAFTCEVMNYRRDGSEIWIGLEVQPIRDEDGELANFIGVTTDLTARRDAELHLLEAKERAEEAAASKTRFLAAMSHEMRTPLNAVIGMSDLLLRTEVDEDQARYVEIARRSATMLLSAVNSLLTYSALDAGRLEIDLAQTSLRDLIASCISVVQADADAKSLAVDLAIGPAVPETILADEVRLGQVMLNLLANAVKFTATGGIHVTVEMDARDAGAEWLLISVADTGIGIAEADLDRLFEPFNQVDATITRRFGGSGLGLAISERLVEMMGGRLQVASRLGVGTSVTLTIPVQAGDGPARAGAPTGADGGGAAHGLRVLVAEDDPLNQEVAVLLLRELGVVAATADTGQEALDALDRSPCDLILMDINMPTMDGLTATREIRAGRAEDDQPWIVAMTANALQGDRERFLAEGADDYLAKPVRLVELADALARGREGLAERRRGGRRV